MPTIHTDRLAEMRRDDPTLYAEIDALRADGIPIIHAIQDEDTGEFYVSTGWGEPYELASPLAGTLLTEPSLRDIVQIDPLLPYAALRDPILKTNHVRKVLEGLYRIVHCCRPDLVDHPWLDTVMIVTNKALTVHRDMLAALPDPFSRWEKLAESFFRLMDNPPGGEAADEPRH